MGADVGAPDYGAPTSAGKALLLTPRARVGAARTACTPFVDNGTTRDYEWTPQREGDYVR